VTAKKPPGYKLKRQLENDAGRAPRTRKRDYDPVSVEQALALVAVEAPQWQETAWVAHGGALHSLLHLNRDRYDKVVASRSRIAGISVDAVWNDVAGALITRSIVVFRSVYARGGAPVFIDSTSRLVGDDLSHHDQWMGRLLRRLVIPSGSKFLKEAGKRGLPRWEASAMAAYALETAIDDLAGLCATTREALLMLTWDDWTDDWIAED
jgi:hypothetical protein